MATLFGVDVLCGVHSNSNQVFLKGLMLPALLSILSYYKKKECHRATDYLTTRTLPSIYSILEMCCHAAQTFPILRAYHYRIGEREESGRRAVLLGGRTRAERGNTCPPFFYSMNPFSFVSKRLAHTGDCLLTCYIHSDDWVPNNGGTEIDMLLHRLVHIHPSHQSHLGRLLLPASAFLLVRIQSGCCSWIKAKNRPRSEYVQKLMNTSWKTNERSCSVTNMAFICLLANNRPYATASFVMQQLK